jgi:alpha-mannosidase
MKVSNSAIVLALLSLPLLAQEQEGKYELSPDQRTGTIRRIFVLCHSHLDIGFTRPPDEVARTYKDNIDTAIRLTRENPDFRWTIESAWMLEEWLRRTDSPALIAELGMMLRDGRMSLGMAFANMHSGLMGAEESNRLIYAGEKFRRQFGIRGEVAFQNDVPGFTWAWPRILAGSGVKRLITGLNLFIGGGNDLGVADDPFYWVGPDGSRVLTYFTYDSYVEGSRWKLGGRYSLAELERSAPRRLAWLEKNGYKYDTYLLMASPGDNIDPMGAYRTLERIREWDRRHPELPMKMAAPEEFFDYLISKYGDRFPSASGDSAGYWENVKLRVPEAAAKMRQVSNDLPAAEMAATIASVTSKISVPEFDLAAAWWSLLAFHEHTADSGGGWPGYFTRWDADWSNTAHYAAALTGFSATEQIFRRSITALAAPDQTAWLANPTAGNSEAATIVVYNGLPWRRGGPVEAERLPVPLRQGPLAVTDTVTGERLPYEDVPGTQRHIVFWAGEVPAAGYRSYSIRKARESQATAAGEFPLEVEWDSAGSITAIRDRAGKRQIVQADAASPFGRLFLGHGREDFRLPDTEPAKITARDGPVARHIEIVRNGSLAPVTVMTLYRGAPYADLSFDVDLGQLRAERGNVRYAIALPLPGSDQLSLDGAGFVIRVPQDFLPGANPPAAKPLHGV